MQRYPNHLLMGWTRNDGAFECLMNLYGDQLEEDQAWNRLVEDCHAGLCHAWALPIEIYQREEMNSVLVVDWTAENEMVPVYIKNPREHALEDV